MVAVHSTLAGLLVTVAAISVDARSLTAAPNNCPRYKVKVLQQTSKDSASLADVVAEFRSLLGGEDNGNAEGPLASGHRSINWDAGIVPFDMPGDFFNDVVPRGAVFETKGSEFRVSNPSETDGQPEDDKFSSINKRAAENFITFSPERLFTPLKDNKFTANFQVAAKEDPAGVTGFGAVYVDVKKRHKTTLTLRDDAGCEIAEVAVPPQAGGLSFVGVKVEKVKKSRRFEKAGSDIAEAELKLGNTAINSSMLSWLRFLLWRRRVDVVVVDDLIYGEPQPLSSP